MKVLVTGANGFIGKHMCLLLSRKGHETFKYDIDSSEEELKEYIKECDAVIHLAGINRPLTPEEFYDGNANFTKKLVDLLLENKKNVPVIMSSSIQAALDNDYGKSKKMGEDFLFSSGLPVYVYRLANVFGKWCRPNYNSVIATFCNNVATNQEIVVNDESKELTLAYIDDVCEEIVKCLEDNPTKENGFCKVPVTYTKTLGYIADLIKSFKENDQGIMVPSTGDEFIKKLYATYISYVPLNEMVVDLTEHRDDRGVFCELVRTKEAGQISVSTTNPGIVRGGHYHHTKMERFIVIKGKAKIEFEHVLTHEKIEFEVSGDRLQYVNIPVGYQHCINNIGNDELILILWANELFDKTKPDTFVMEEKDECRKRV